MAANTPDGARHHVAPYGESQSKTLSAELMPSVPSGWVENGSKRIEMRVQRCKVTKRFPATVGTCYVLYCIVHQLHRRRGGAHPAGLAADCHLQRSLLLDLLG
jgi:hypothetical protein